jgi:hypothetical protein
VAHCTPPQVRSAPQGVHADRPPARPHVAHEWKGRSLGVLKEYSRGAQAVLEDTQRGLQEYSRGTLGLGPWAAIAIPQNVHGSRRTPTEPSRVLKRYSRSTQAVLKEYSHV